MNLLVILTVSCVLYTEYLYYFIPHGCNTSTCINAKSKFALTLCGN